MWLPGRNILSRWDRIRNEGLHTRLLGGSSSRRSFNGPKLLARVVAVDPFRLGNLKTFPGYSFGLFFFLDRGKRKEGSNAFRTEKNARHRHPLGLNDLRSLEPVDRRWDHPAASHQPPPCPSPLPTFARQPAPSRPPVAIGLASPFTADQHVTRFFPCIHANLLTGISLEDKAMK